MSHHSGETFILFARGTCEIEAGLNWRLLRA
jgi:hypothetical protein